MCIIYCIPVYRVMYSIYKKKLQYSCAIRRLYTLYSIVYCNSHFRVGVPGVSILLLNHGLRISAALALAEIGVKGGRALGDGDGDNDARLDAGEAPCKVFSFSSRVMRASVSAA